MEIIAARCSLGHSFSGPHHPSQARIPDTLNLSGFVFSLWKNSYKPLIRFYTPFLQWWNLKLILLNKQRDGKVPLIFCRGSLTPGYPHKAFLGAALPLQNFCIALNLHT